MTQSSLARGGLNVRGGFPMIPPRFGPPVQRSASEPV